MKKDLMSKSKVAPTSFSRPQSASLTRILAFFLAFGWLGVALTVNVVGEDWPEWRGRGRQGLWTEDGVLSQFPDDGLRFKWRTQIEAGYSGPAVAEDRVFVMDFLETPGTRTMDGTERLLCLDQDSGGILWTLEWKTSYRMLMGTYAIGPRATPTVDGDRVYAVGAAGMLRCVDVKNGKLIWGKDYIKDFGTSVPVWGIASAPLVDGERLICVVGGEGGARVIAFDKATGKEIWRGLSSEWEMGYEQPVIFGTGESRQLIIWHPKGVSSLNPETGEVYWEEPFEVRSGLTVATPVMNGSKLLVSQFYGGSMLLDLGTGPEGKELVWKVGGTSELPDKTQGLHALIATPIIQNGYIYGVCSYGQLRCLDLGTGARVWESQEMTDFARWAAAFAVQNEDRFFVNNDKGELIIARFTPQGYEEIDRTFLIEPTSNSAWGGRRRPRSSDRMVNWSHPAYADRHIFARNDREVLCASLESFD
jgi:outer membrane protein assembly factor BamB